MTLSILFFILFLPKFETNVKKGNVGGHRCSAHSRQDIETTSYNDFRVLLLIRVVQDNLYSR